MTREAETEFLTQLLFRRHILLKLFSFFVTDIDI